MNTNAHLQFFQNYHNLLLMSDSYKVTHWAMLPPGLGNTESYCESRGGSFPFTMFFGLQYYMKSYLAGQQVTEEKIQEAKEFYAAHFGNADYFNEEGWRYILEKHNGYLPIGIKAVKEGSIVPIKNVLYKIYSTDPKCGWLVKWCETLLMKMWYTITVSTNSMAAREIIDYYHTMSGVTSAPQFMLHDFGYRGVASEEQAWLGGACHLLSFAGSDNVAGIRMLMKYYAAPMCGYSVAASEHMVMSITGREGEIATYKRILASMRVGVVSLVSDTYDVYNLCEQASSDPEFKELILSRDGKFVIRLDSGDPIEVIEKCLGILEAGFGATINEKGYKTLNPKIGLLQGDGISLHSMSNIIQYFVEHKKWSIDNFVFGSGGKLLQAFDRDTLQFTIKACYAELDGVGVDVYKDPITSKGSKTSKRGQLHLMYNKVKGYYTINSHEAKHDESDQDMLELVFLNGKIIQEITYAELMENFAKHKLMEYPEQVTEVTVDKKENATA